MTSDATSTINLLCAGHHLLTVLVDVLLITLVFTDLFCFCSANDIHKPLPDPMHHPLGSDMSSLGPSQSASQIALPLENGFAEHG